MNQRIAVVLASNEYAASFRACLDVIARERRYIAQVEAPPIERVEAFVRDNASSAGIQFFALDGARVVGWADIVPHWAYALSHCGSLGMGVHPDYRRQGLGRRLLAACIEQAWARGLTRIELEARADNHAAIALYERLGFRVEAVKSQAMRFDDQYFDAVQMRLLRDEG